MNEGKISIVIVPPAGSRTHQWTVSVVRAKLIAWAVVVAFVLLLVETGALLMLGGTVRRARRLSDENDSLQVAATRMIDLESRLASLEVADDQIRGLLQADSGEPLDAPPPVQLQGAGLPEKQWRMSPPQQLPHDGPVSRGFQLAGVAPHTGIDISGRVGAPIRAGGGGIVKSTNDDAVYGKLLIIDHGRGVESLYGHNDAIVATVGDSVNVGQVVARLGNTGQSTAPHVHFEIRVDGSPVDPAEFVAGSGSP